MDISQGVQMNALQPINIVATNTGISSRTLYPGQEEHIERVDEKGGYFIPVLFPVRKKR